MHPPSPSKHTQRYTISHAEKCTRTLRPVEGAPARFATPMATQAAHRGMPVSKWTPTGVPGCAHDRLDAPMTGAALTNAAQLPSSQHRLQQVPGIHGPARRARAHHLRSRSTAQRGTADEAMLPKPAPFATHGAMHAPHAHTSGHTRKAHTHTHTCFNTLIHAHTVRLPRAGLTFRGLWLSASPLLLHLSSLTVWISSMKRIILPAESVTSLITDFRRSSNSPRNLAPADKKSIRETNRRLHLRKMNEGEQKGGPRSLQPRLGAVPLCSPRRHAALTQYIRTEQSTSMHMYKRVWVLTFAFCCSMASIWLTSSPLRQPQPSAHVPELNGTQPSAKYFEPNGLQPRTLVCKLTLLQTDT